MAQVLLAHPGIDVNVQDEVRKRLLREQVHAACMISNVRYIQFVNNCVTLL